MLSSALYWINATVLIIVLVIMLALATSRWVLLPYAIEPALKRQIEVIEDQLGQIADEKIAIDFSSVKFSIGIHGIYVSILDPRISIGTEPGRPSLQADIAGVVINRESVLPELFVTGAEIAIVEDAQGNFTLANLSSSTASDHGLDLTSLLAAAGKLPPFSIVAHRTKLTVKRAASDETKLVSLSASAYPDPQALSYIINLANANSVARAELSLPATEQGQLQASWYFQTDTPNAFAQLLELPVNARVGYIQAWGSYANDAHEAIVVADSTDFAWRSDPYAVTLEHAQFAAGIAWQPSEVLATVRIAADDIIFASPTHILGTVLALDKAAAFGSLRVDEDSWQADIADLRASHNDTGSIGLASLYLGDTGAGLHMDLTVRAPQVDLPWIAELLPDDLGDPTLGLLREDLTAGLTQLSTLVIRGEPEGFPWHDDPDGQFLLGVAFEQATLNYQPGWPAANAGQGRLTLNGSRLDLTVDRAQLAGLGVGPVYAAVDNLEAIPSTVYIAGAAQIHGRQLTDAMAALPPVAAQLEQYPKLDLVGTQVAELRLAVPLDTDDDIVFEGSIDMQDNVLLWQSPTVQVDQINGKIGFANSGIDGILRGHMLDTPVRISIQLAADAPPLIDIAGNFDLAYAIEKLGYGKHDLPVTGASPYIAHYDGDTLDLSSSLLGARVDLPASLGKAADEKRNLAIQIGAGPIAVDYGNGMLRAIVHEQGADLIIGKAAPLSASATEPGLRIAASFPELDLDETVAWAAQASGSEPVTVAASITAKQAQLLGLEQNELAMSLTANATITVISVASDILAGQAQLYGPTLAVTIDRLVLPYEDQPSPADDSTIVVPDGKLSRALPALELTAHQVQAGEILLPQLQLSGFPQDDRWELARMAIPLAGSTIHISGSTAVRDRPHTRLRINAQDKGLQDLVEILSYQSEISGGVISIAGEIEWEGEIEKMHLPSLRGTVDLDASNFRMSQLDGESAKLTRLFSPMALLTLGLVELGEKGLDFSKAAGRIEIENGTAYFRNIKLTGEDVSMDITGSSNMITERHDVHVAATVHNSNQVFTAGAAIFNPLLAGTLFLFDNILNKPIIKPFEVKYSITGSWDEPIVTSDSEPAVLPP